MRNTTPLLLTLLLTASSFALTEVDVPEEKPAPPAAPALKDAKLDLAPLEKIPPQKFSIHRLRGDGEIPVGSLALTTKLQKDAVTFEDTYTETRGGGDLVYTLTTTTTRTPALSPTAMTCKNKLNTMEQTFKVAVKEGTATVTAEGGAKVRDRTFNLSDNTPTWFGLFRIAPLLPRDKEQSWTVPALLHDFRLRPRDRELTITAHGLKPTFVDGKKVQWHYITIVPSNVDNVPDRDKIEIWLDDKGDLRELYIEDLRFTRITEKPAPAKKD